MRSRVLRWALALAAVVAALWWVSSATGGLAAAAEASLEQLRAGVSETWQFFLIVLGTFVLEDPTTVATGLLVSQGRVSPALGVGAVFVGIFVGDLGLYLTGRLLGSRLEKWGWFGQGSQARASRLRDWLERRGWAAIVASRFLPGTRVPLYVGAGAVGAPVGPFAVRTCCAVLIWAPVMVGLVVLLERVPGSPFARLLSIGWFGLLAAAVAAYVTLRVVTLTLTRVGRCKLVAAISRLWRWEFWPSWLFYLPIVPGWLLLAWRHRSFTVWTLANPGIPLGGLVGESKSEILEQLVSEGQPAFVSEFARIEAGGDPAARAASARRVAAERGWSYPVVLKPDAGQRGVGVRRIANDEAATSYFAETPGPVLVQPLCTYREEAGVFYVRTPGADRGRIFSVTSKRFPSVVGDGRSTLAELIWAHPRCRMQAKRFLRRYPEAVWTQPAAGERVELAFAGNHSQGVEFRDGAHLVTPALTAAIDAVARRFEGFYFGRFDLRYRDDEALREGRDLTILELNGVTSESTDVYDPSNTLLHAWRRLLEQWRLAFEIGAAHRASGLAAPPLRALAAAVSAYYRTRQVSDLSD